MQLRRKKYICFYPLTWIHNIAYIKKRQIYNYNNNNNNNNIYTGGVLTLSGFGELS